jgi:hypothetical protein
MSEGSGKNATIIIALITVLGSVLTAVITNWDKLFPPTTSSSTAGDAAPKRVLPTDGGSVTSGSTASNDAPRRKEDPSFDFSDLPTRSYRVGVVTIQGIRLSPTPPATLAQNQQVNTRFDYDVCCGASVNIWVRPVWSGGQCSYAASGSPRYSGTGTGTSDFNMRGADCTLTQITGIRFSVKNLDNDNEDMTVIPVQYTFSN